MPDKKTMAEHIIEKTSDDIGPGPWEAEIPGVPGHGIVTLTRLGSAKPGEPSVAFALISYDGSEVSVLGVWRDRAKAHLHLALYSLSGLVAASLTAEEVATAKRMTDDAATPDDAFRNVSDYLKQRLGDDDIVRGATLRAAMLATPTKTVH